jgi:hypothetical protein
LVFLLSMYHSLDVLVGLTQFKDAL